MILQCPECSARFLIDASMVPPEGREVRCAKCNHTWHAEPEEPETPIAQDTPSEEAPEEQAAQDDDTQEDVEYIDFGDEAPAEASIEPEAMPEPIAMSTTPKEPAPTLLQSLKPLMVAATILFFITTLLTGLLAFRSSLQPMLEPIYAMMGMASTQGLVLSDVSIRERPSRSKKRLVAEGKIINLSDGVRAIPPLRVTIYDAQGEPVISKEYETDTILKPGESSPFIARNLDTAFVDRVDHLVVDLGNGVELMLRGEPE